MRSRLALFLAPLLLAPAIPLIASAAAPRDLYVKSFGKVSAKKVRTLIIVLHGDTDGTGPAEHYAFAKTAAQAVPGSVAAAVLRPGYVDAQGNKSPGDRGTMAGDNLTTDRLDAIAATVRKLQRRYKNARTVLVGDKSGAAMAADLAAAHPELADGMVLVACPCTLPEWRSYMKTVSPTPLWDQPVKSLDPIKLVGGVRAGFRAAVLVGADDKTTPIRFSRTYAEALTLRGIATDYRILPGKGHDLLDDPEVLAATQRLAAALPGKRI
jgi:predicted esterase